MGEKTTFKNIELVKEYLKLIKKRRVEFCDFVKKYKKKMLKQG